MPELHPSERYPDLTPERLAIVANILAHERDDAAMDHHPERGETEFSLGVSAWERTKAAIIGAAQNYSWLRVADGESPGPSQFTFQIGVYPVRFFHGTADEVPARYLQRTDPEQMDFPYEHALPSGHILRFSVETNAIRRTSSIDLIEVDQFDEVVWRFAVPFSTADKVMPFRETKRDGVDLGAPTVEVIQSGRQAKND